MVTLLQISSPNKLLASQQNSWRGELMAETLRRCSVTTTPNAGVSEKIRVGEIGQNTASFTKNKVLASNKTGRRQKLLTC